MFCLGSQGDVSLETCHRGTQREELRLGGGPVEWQLGGAPGCWLYESTQFFVSIHPAFEKLEIPKVVDPH